MPPIAPDLTPLPPPPRRRFNRVAVYLAVAIAVGTLPFTLHHQTERFRYGPPPSPGERPNEQRQWAMPELRDITETRARERFGEPVESRDYPLNQGSFAGPRVGLKHYYRMSDPEYDKHMKDAETAWTFPEYTAVREIIWKLPDSYLTLWLQEPRAEVTLEGDNADVTLPSTAAGEWVALDNYRVGKDLIKKGPGLR